MDKNPTGDASPTKSPIKSTHGSTDPPPSDKETLPHTQDVEALMAEIDHLKWKVAILKGEAGEKSSLCNEQSLILFSGGEGWLPVYNRELEAEVKSVLQDVGNWCRQYALGGPTEVAHLSPCEKQSIIRSLEGYWVQDLDWDTLMRSFPFPISQNVLQLVAQTMLTKDIIEKVFENPFWYLEASDQQEKSQRSDCFAWHLQRLYLPFVESKPVTLHTDAPPRFFLLHVC
ncbi:hypothetical protein BO94DRAFT_587076 [Aspergillus sclerotioniger CBS 115572]|uniref:Uncharacterized protein n=1 Tax=Aspergillus sclerotioniger CBS 115572 TaxID=1450535 RepID=A0A317WAE0_9EURO|nr:hypothetical protein BO94DRAFT_587076 [Aspergillus sclerotioniger CBS 115572]PWY83179.1 hypothetical protein BO94DRAFT_587076 [Aspergillus sclerotioniger CBS 115572]